MQQLVNLLSGNKWRVISTVVLLALLGLVSYKLWCYPYRAVEAVPGTTAAVFNIPADKAKDSVSDSAKTVPFFDAFPELQQDYKAFQSFFRQAGGTVPGEAEWMIQNLGPGQLALSLAVEAPSFPLERALSLYQTEATVFRGESIWKLSTPEGSGLALARYRNLLLIGRLPLQVEACITQLKESTSGWSVPELKAARHLYLRVDNLSGLGSGIWAPTLRNALREFEPYCQGLNLSFERNGDTLDIHGLIEGQQSFASVAPEQDSDGAILNYLPDNLAWCFRKTIDSFSASGSGLLYTQSLKSWAGTELALASMALPGNEKENQFLLLSVQSQAAARIQLDSLVQQLGALEAYDFQSFRITRLRADSLLQPLGLGMGHPYFTILGDYVAFSESKLVLQQLISTTLAGKTLVQDEAFLRLWASLKADGHHLWAFANASFLRLRLPAYLEQQKEALASLLKPFEALMVVVGEGGEIQGRVLPKDSEKAEPASGMAWIANLDTTVASAVYHLPMEEAQASFLVQDEAQALYLFSSAGERLWKKPLQEALAGAVEYLPSRRSSRRSFAFATSGKIHRWDARGRPVAGFPVSLPAPASSPLLVVDFEGQQRYNFFVACENGKIYGFDGRGLPLEGWSPQEQLDSLVRQPMAHFQKDNNDFLIALSEAGTLYAFRRDGGFRFEPVQTGAKFRSPPFFQLEEGMERIAMGDERGLGHIVNFQGDYFRLKLMPELEEGTRFLFANLSGDERKDYFSYRKEALVARFYEELKIVTHFSQQFEMPADTAFLLKLNKKTGIGLLHRQERKVSLIDESGQLLPDFPLRGDVPYVLLQEDGESQLAIIGYENSIYAYRFY